MEDSQQLLDSEDEKQEDTERRQSQNTSEETYNQWKKSRLQQDIDR